MKRKGICKLLFWFICIFAILNGFVYLRCHKMIYGNCKEYNPSGMPEAVSHSAEEIDAGGKNGVGKGSKSSFADAGNNAVVDGYCAEEYPRDAPCVCEESDK